VPIYEVVEHHRLDAMPLQRSNRMAADVAGAAGDQDQRHR
jgi:hypothetical protein